MSSDFAMPSVTRRSVERGLWAVAALWSVSAGSEGVGQALVVVYDSGRTVPVVQFLASFYNEAEARAASNTTPSDVPAAVSFPVSTHGMRPGRLPAPIRLAVTVPLPSAIFVVGSDDASRAWLARTRGTLARLRATGIVVNADTWEDFRGVRLIGQGLPMAPSSVDGLLPPLGLTVYPVLIQANGRVTQ